MEIIIGLLAALFGGIHVKSKKAARERDKRVEAAGTFEHRNVYGNSRWAELADLGKAGLTGRNGIFFGYAPDGYSRLFYKGAGHVLICAAARGGKLLTILVGMIAQLGKSYSLFMLDPKGELTPIIAPIRAKVGRVHIWNPYSVALDYLQGFACDGWNPFADIDRNSINCYGDILSIFKTYWDDPTVSTDPHWLEKSLPVAATVGYALHKYGREDENNLPTVYKIISGGNGETFNDFCRYACKSIDDQIVRQGLFEWGVPGAEENRELAGVRSSALTQMAFLNDPAVAESLMDADFSFMDAKVASGSTYSVILPIHRMGDGKLFRLASGWMLRCSLEQGAKGYTGKVVAILDEMSQLGFQKTLQDAFGLAAGAAGLQIVAVYQDVNQMVAQFPKSWQTIMQNCAVKCFFRVNDTETRKQVSEMCGTQQVVTESKGVSWGVEAKEPSVSGNKNVASQPLITPMETSQLADDEMIVISDQVPCGPIKAKRKPYTRTESGYGENPYYQEQSSSFWGWLDWIF